MHSHSSIQCTPKVCKLQCSSDLRTCDRSGPLPTPRVSAGQTPEPRDYLCGMHHPHCKAEECCGPQGRCYPQSGPDNLAYCGNGCSLTYSSGCDNGDDPCQYFIDNPQQPVKNAATGKAPGRDAWACIQKSWALAGCTNAPLTTEADVDAVPTTSWWSNQTLTNMRADMQAWATMPGLERQRGCYRECRSCIVSQCVFVGVCAGESDMRGNGGAGCDR
jgi:hypothetical protein